MIIINRNAALGKGDMCSSCFKNPAAVPVVAAVAALDEDMLPCPICRDNFSVAAIFTHQTECRQREVSKRSKTAPFAGIGTNSVHIGSTHVCFYR